MIVELGPGRPAHNLCCLGQGRGGLLYPLPGGGGTWYTGKKQGAAFWAGKEGFMMDATWLEVTLDAKREELDMLSAQLIANGAPGLVVEDEEDFQKFLEENRQCWDYVDDELLAQMRGVCRIKFYVTDDEDGQGQLAKYLTGVNHPYATIPLQENDWAHSWQKYYRPFPVGQRLYVVPQWERETPVPHKRTPLYLNPGLTFGTGSHASTQLCLEGVEAATQGEDLVLDLGCGSGILSIAALKLGAAKAVAVDIDPKAVGVAYENAALNGIGRDRYLVRAGDVLSDEGLRRELAAKRYHLVLANIVADVIIPLAPLAREWMRPEGLFLCSGIIDLRGDEVTAALERAGLVVVERREKNGWIALAARLAPN